MKGLGESKRYGSTVLLVFPLQPLGPLTVAEGRVKTYADALQNLFLKQGDDAQQLGFINDVGAATDLLGVCIWIRYLELCGESIEFPSYALFGDYVFDLAATVHRRHGESFHRPWKKQWAKLNQAEMICKVRGILGIDFDIITDIGTTAIVSDIQRDMNEYGRACDQWISKKSLMATDEFVHHKWRCLNHLQMLGMVIKIGNDLWLQGTDSDLYNAELIQRGSEELSALGSYIVFCDMLLQIGYREIFFISNGATASLPAIKDVLDTLVGDRCDKQGAQGVTVVSVGDVLVKEADELVPTSIFHEQSMTFRELRQIKGNDQSKLQYFRAPVADNMAIHLDPAAGKDDGQGGREGQEGLLQLCDLHEFLEQRLTANQQNPRIGMECESVAMPSGVNSQWMNLLAQYEIAVANSTINRDPGIVCGYLCKLANFTKTHYNALLFAPTLEPQQQDVLLQSHSVLNKGLKILGLLSDLE